MKPEDVKRWIYLVKMRTVFSQRTNFIDMYEVKNAIENRTDIFKDCLVQVVFGPDSLLQINSPQQNLKIKLGDLYLSLYINLNRIDLVLDGAYEPTNYDAALEHYMRACKQLAPIVSNNMDLCGSLALDCNSFLVIDDPVFLIRHRYINKNIDDKISRLAVIYDSTVELAGYETQIMNTVKSDFINFTPQVKGINLFRSVSMLNTYLSISKEHIELYLHHAFECLSRLEMEKLVYYD